MSYHEPVLLSEAIEAMNIRPDGIYVDATFGGGGHAKAILKKLKTGKLYSFDQDEDAEKNSPADKKFTLIKSNFRYIKRFMRYHDAIPVDGILADLGISSHQIDTPQRGFSLRHDAPLDMRMNAGQKQTAEDVVNTYEEEKLVKIFSEYGEVENAKRVSAQIVSARRAKAITTTKELIDALDRCIDKRFPSKYLAKIFQALRIEVNDEINSLKEFLMQSAEVIGTGGRLVVISYHSLEDRLVKNILRTGKFEGDTEKDLYGKLVNVPFNSLTKKPIAASEEEIQNNPRARSARMRTGEKI
ncbi:MAG TPA: 16S rRNA (cytosine(1402)-N(4))-methyltransferase RsmH [Bacteroidia bacterium]|nr:16S rRNA (cytosine(1402)-N(4))-methyltransferase RsmH [Bacteroidia bacterium]